MQTPAGGLLCVNGLLFLSLLLQSFYRLLGGVVVKVQELLLDLLRDLESVWMSLRVSLAEGTLDGLVLQVGCQRALPTHTVLAGF